MVDYNLPLFQHPQETWDLAKCKKLAKRVVKDGMGTKHPRPGYLGCSQPYSEYKFGDFRYNGGCIREAEWYQGEFFPEPIVAEGYEIVWVTAWGHYLIFTPKSNGE